MTTQEGVAVKEMVLVVKAVMWEIVVMGRAVAHRDSQERRVVSMMLVMVVALVALVGGVYGTAQVEQGGSLITLALQRPLRQGVEEVVASRTILTRVTTDWVALVEGRELPGLLVRRMAIQAAGQQEEVVVDGVLPVERIPILGAVLGMPEPLGVRQSNLTVLERLHGLAAAERLTSMEQCHENKLVALRVDLLHGQSS